MRCLRAIRATCLGLGTITSCPSFAGIRFIHSDRGPTSAVPDDGAVAAAIAHVDADGQLSRVPLLLLPVDAVRCPAGRSSPRCSGSCEPSWPIRGRFFGNSPLRRGADPQRSRMAGLCRALVAQWTEQRTSNPRVAGSNPAEGASSPGASGGRQGQCGPLSGRLAAWRRPAPASRCHPTSGVAPEPPPSGVRRNRGRLGPRSGHSTACTHPRVAVAATRAGRGGDYLR